jgi:hypothetical protein
MPEAPEPQAELAPEAPTELLGAPVETAAAPAVEAPAQPALAAAPLREGWGTMAPIANPSESPARRLARGASEPMPATPPAYALVGPAAPEPAPRTLRATVDKAAAPARRAQPRLASVPAVRAPTRYVMLDAPAGVSRIAAPVRPTTLKGRIRHWIMPVRNPT